MLHISRDGLFHWIAGSSRFLGNIFKSVSEVEFALDAMKMTDSLGPGVSARALSSLKAQKLSEQSREGRLEALSGLMFSGVRLALFPSK